MSDFNPLEINFDDAETWDLICSGRTKGVFHLERDLGLKELSQKTLKNFLL